MNTWSVVALGLCLCASCGGKARNPAAGARPGDAGDASAPDAAADARADARADAQADARADARADACASATIPREHRALAQACASARGSVGPLDTSACTDRSSITCTRDADCTAGKNGRCFGNGDLCHTLCSYDQCLADADCAAGPCLCRTDGTDLSPGICLPGSNCRTDADCDGCEYCSPSAVADSTHCEAGICPCAGLTYACHTANDECINSGECAENNCGYNAGSGRWACAACMGPPPPHL